MTNPEFKLTDNNAFTEKGSLLELIKENVIEATELNICTAFFYNPIKDENSRENIYDYIYHNNPKLKIKIILSERIGNLKDVLISYLKNDGKVKETYEKYYDKLLLKKLKSLDIEFYVIRRDKDNKFRFFHPKLYLFQNNGKSIAFITGSGNFTTPGLEDNIELNFLEKESNRCQRVKNWFDNVLKFAETLSVEFLENLNYELDPVYEGNFTFEKGKNLVELTSNEEISTGKLPIITKILPLNEPALVDYKIREMELIIKGIDFNDPLKGIPISVEKDKIIAFSIGYLNDIDVYESVSYIKCKTDAIIKIFLEKYKINKQDLWIKEFARNFESLTIKDGIELDLLINSKKITIQTLTNDGNIFQVEIFLDMDNI